MTTTTHPDHPKGKVRHRLRCDRRSPVLETVRQDATGQARVCWMCQSCGGTDLDSRMLDKLTGPEGGGR